ncbi:hypothetical protein [Roseospira navarrensis]|uniref:O-antigen ligase domain-containing protein n=1 Tax=Roseospira navarrensis TaxID=140058 RepID=A0A7X1ZFT2_9PROT|nr:hypothetical protein [Roseospira navarrensis]MQX37721.1 hypothetical protein [Roseospira navarrensis]
MPLRLRHLALLALLAWVVAMIHEKATTPGVQLTTAPPAAEGGLRLVMLLALVGMTAVVGLLAAIRPKEVLGPLRDDPQITLLAGLAGVLFLVSLAILRVDSAAYAVLFLVVILFCAYCNAAFPGRFFLVVAGVLVLGLVAFVALFGLPTGRVIGFIHPNAIGSFGLATTYFASRSGHPARYGLYAVALGFALAVNSRYAILAMAIIIAFEALQSMRHVTWPKLLLGAAAGVGGLLVLTAAADWIIADVLRIYDPARGLAGGISGRFDQYADFGWQIAERPFLGYGFRNREAYIPAHNGFLNFLLENGVLVTGLLAVCLGYAIVSNARDPGDGPLPRNRLILGHWIAWALAGFFEPQIINFGDTFALMTMVLLTDTRRIRSRPGET